MDVFSDTTGEKYIYRYRSDNIKRAESEIGERYIFVCPKSKLNDINEFQWGIHNSAENLSVAELEHWMLQQTSLQGYDNKPYHIEKKLALSQGCDENEFIRNSAKGLIGSMKEAAREIQSRILASKVACFSRKPVNPTMMGHYGNNQGVIIAYDKILLEEVIGKGKLHTVDYVETPKSFDIANDLSSRPDSSLLIATKFIDWKFESEVRVVTENSVTKLDLPPGIIKGVCFAPKVSSNFKEKISIVCSRNLIPVYQAERIPNEYEFSAIRINSERLLTAG